MSHELELTGLDGSNPLAFLAALGALRVLTLAQPEHEPKLGWRITQGAWRPIVVTTEPIDADGFVSTLDRRLKPMTDHPAWAFADNLKVAAPNFQAYAREAAHQSAQSRDRVWADFVAAFGCEAIANNDGTIQDTALRTMSGAGHQHFLKFMRDLAANTNEAHLREALFQPWRYADPGPSMRWDPRDDRRYALRWDEPSGDPIRTVRGANRLAIEGLPLLPTMPVGASLATTGFAGTRSHDTFLTWPIWSAPATVYVARSILSLPELQANPVARHVLTPLGIVEVYRCQRLTIGKYRNFTPAQPV